MIETRVWRLFPIEVNLREDGANSTEIAAVRERFIQDMKILESIAPESGAYLNEVKESNTPSCNLTSFLGFGI